jgi:hypothetical protein
MSDKLTVDVDSRALYATLDRLGAIGEKHVKAAAKVTAHAIANEMRRRIRRRSAGPTRSRHTAEGITVDESHDGKGYVIYIDSPDMPNLPLWLEFGTKHMTASPFAFNSARLEEGAHDRRTRAAVQDAIDELGLGRP